MVFLYWLVGYYLYLKGLEPIPERPKSSLEEEVEKADTVWFAWHSGSVRLAEGGTLFEMNKKYRIILTDPNSQAIKELGKVSNVGSGKLEADIRELTNKLIEQNQNVKWFDGFLGSSIIIANPNKENGWVRIESFIPIMASKFRPGIKIYRQGHEQKFLRYRDLYDEIWNNKSVDASVSDLS